MGQKVVITISTIILLFTGTLLGYVLSQLVRGTLVLNLVTFLGTFSLIVIFATLYYVLFWEFRKQQKPKNRGRIQPPNGYSSINNDEEIAPNTQLKNRLINLLSGDIEGASRLVEQAKRTYPDMPENWYWERVIADIERDRR
ncbi:ABC transporter permease [Calothrix sp. UHCC 0171]|uniref:ABC transporter permease n=1 Tax=Calothrix sp. UHCC 0171 TaxID=3110245 RepID=UPI002B216457|nr:ABC transporter permease [Calothrix sp. UHCC 0171]MEA5571457.1 ABC transporter permease [Calothrix sp. UHCC 0171]